MDAETAMRKEDPTRRARQLSKEMTEGEFQTSMREFMKGVAKALIS